MYCDLNDWTLTLETRGYMIKDIICADRDVTEVEVVSPNKTTVMCTITRRPCVFERITKALTSVHHKNVVKMLDSFHEKSMFFIVHEKYSEKNLEQVVPLAKEEITMYALQIISAVEAINNAGIYIGNLSPKNIYFDRYGLIKIVDFRESFPMPRRFCTTYETTNKRPAPEVVDQTPFNPKAADLWNLGVVIYFIVNGKYPFSECKDVAKYKAEIEDAIKNIECSDTMPYKNAIQDLLQVDPFDRAKIESIDRYFGLIKVQLPKGTLQTHRSVEHIAIHRRSKIRPIHLLSYADVKSYYNSV